MLSYPPSFRQTELPSPPTDDYHDSNRNPDDIPIIDAQRLDPVRLHKACRDWGVFRVINHGIPKTTQEDLMDCAKKLFDLPFETKQRLLSNNSKEGGDGDGFEKLLAYFWGTPVLTPSGEVVPQGPRPVDWVEGFNAAVGELRRLPQEQEQEPIKGTVDQHDPVFIIRKFSNILKDYGDQVTRLATTLFKSMAENLELLHHQTDHHHLRTYLDESTALLRVYRYPALTKIPHHQNPHPKGLESHTDSSVLSILNQDEVGGLEFLKPARSTNTTTTDEDDDTNCWVRVNPVPGSLVVNLGDMMQALSGDEYPSVTHRVRLHTSRERLSVCYFVFPDENVPVTSSKKYRDFTYSEFREQVRRDVATTGKKIGLQHYGCKRC